MSTPSRTGRHVPLERSWNLRHLGGYVTDNGQHTAAGVVWRADGLHRLGPADVEKVAALGIGVVVDLRTAHEVDEFGAFDGADHGIVRHHIPVLDETWDRDAVPDVPHHQYLAERYLEMAETGARAIVETLRIVADATVPVAFHCTAGKDRTGVTAALLLSLVGVDDHTVAGDYGLTSPATEEFVAWLAVEDPERHQQFERDVPPVFLASPPDAVLSFLHGIRQRHGSVAGWAHDNDLGHTDVDRLRRRLLTDG